ncbi:MAG: type IV pilus modification protein PilV [Pseudomonadota bacterium]
MSSGFKAVTKTQGFTLVEVLVALVVMSVGMLGIAALYVSGVQGTRGAIFQTKAINLAADMADRIRSNRTAPAAYAAAGAGAAADCADDGAAGANLCTPAQIAANDVFVWNQTLNNARTGLPAPINGAQMGTVAVNPATTPPTYTITVNWSEPGLGDVSYVLTAEM